MITVLNMRKTIAFIVLAILTFSACKKDDSHLFSKSPDERINEALAAYQTQLTTAPNGWKGFIYPKSGGVYTFYFRFNDSNRVSMLSSFDSVSAITLKESSYRLKALQQPSLLFDTYSYLHVLADPNPNVNGGTVGVGLQSDFEFYFDSSSADTINLVGRLNGSRATLVKATPEEAAGFTSGQLAEGFLLNKILTYFKRLTIGSEKLDFNINSLTRTISLVDATGNLLDTLLSTRYFMTFGGVGFVKPLVANNQNITGISNINYNPSNETISCTVNNAAATISSVIVPLKVDINAPAKWYNFKASDPNAPYWFSFGGFHVNGVDNAYRLDTLTSSNLPYYYWIYWPKYAAGNDLYGPALVDTSNSLTLHYASAPAAPSFTGDGRAIFTELGTYGNYPASGPAFEMATQLYIRRGYYFVQTSQNTFDMVSALDGKSWLSWQ
ncbi:DUF4302 domain-containing protein [Segetibacter koreensis]|uniref:DUF4302 domain-containing protein n=1 Tax=Segetibacter koreensis TaxID=398037 RepID=UPI000381FD48|nr:DUF4302 domain-containing protein [Segetibacter koreensis]